MNFKRYILAVIALFVFIFAYESVVHGMVLINIYKETPNIWRTYDEMVSFAPFNHIVMAILALWITFIFTRFYNTGGIKNGFKFGIYMGILAGIQAAGALFYLPISEVLAGAWFITYVIESTIGGLIIGSIYRNDE